MMRHDELNRVSKLLPGAFTEAMRCPHIPRQRYATTTTKRYGPARAKHRASGNVDGVRRKELRRLGDANVRRNRPESPAKGLYGRFRLEHVEDVEAVRALASGMKQETFEGKVRCRLDAR